MGHEPLEEVSGGKGWCFRFRLWLRSVLGQCCIKLLTGNVSSDLCGEDFGTVAVDGAVW